MARYLRRLFAGAKYHVTNRGNGRQAIFEGPEDYRRFIAQLHEAVAKDGVRVYAYCLMPNHLHLFVETPRGNLDRFMDRLGTAYAMYWRYRHRSPGHCFQGRYKAPLVEGDDYALRLTRYIHLNPVKIKALRTASATEKWARLQAYAWSSAPGYLREDRAEEIVDYRWLRLLDGRSLAAARRKYGQYLQGCLEQDDEELLTALAASVYAVGNAQYREEQEGWARQAGQGRRHRADLVLPAEEPVPMEEIERQVVREFGVGSDALKAAWARVGWARAALIELGCSVGGLTQRAMARHLGDRSEHTVSKQRQRLRRAMDTDEPLARRMARLRRQISKF